MLLSIFATTIATAAFYVAGFAMVSYKYHYSLSPHATERLWDGMRRPRAIRKQLVLTTAIGTISGALCTLLLYICESHIIAILVPITIFTCLPLLPIIWFLNQGRQQETVALGVTITDSKQHSSSYNKLLSIRDTILAEVAPNQFELLATAVALQNGCYFDEALELLDTPPRVDPELWDQFIIARLVSLANLGEIHAFTVDLKRLPPLSAHSIYGETRDLMEALMQVKSGRAQSGYDKAAATERATTERHRRMVLAHASFALGRHDEAEEHMAWLQERYGIHGLRMVVESHGPASADAEARLPGKHQGHYRAAPGSPKTDASQRTYSPPTIAHPSPLARLHTRLVVNILLLAAAIMSLAALPLALDVAISDNAGSAIITLTVLTGLVVFFVLGWRYRVQQAQLVAHVATLDPVLATIESITDRGSDEEKAIVVKMRLRVVSDPSERLLGDRPIHIPRTSIPRLYAHLMYRGASIMIRHDPKLYDYILIDWEATRTLQAEQDQSITPDP